MPIYEYICESCGNKFEKLMRRGEAAGACPGCGDQHLTQEYSTFAPRAGSGAKSSAAPQCPAGMCGNPGMCARN
jgi:putative FmdB family regulatory protein